MYTYFLILNDFGIRPGTVWSLALIKQNFPRTTDYYQPLLSTLVQSKDAAGKVIAESQYGNTNLLFTGTADEKAD